MPAHGPRVSVVVPAYNAARFLPETLATILSQTLEGLEVILVDDGSEDETGMVARGMNDARIRMIRQENSGVCAARNRGLVEARGEFVVFFDSDDLMGPEFLRLRVAALDAMPAAAFSAGRVQKVDSDGAPLPELLYPPREGSFFEDILLYRAAIATCPSNFLIRRERLHSLGIRFNPALWSSADRFFLLELSRAGGGLLLEDPGARLIYRVHPGSMSHSISPQLIEDGRMFAVEVSRLGFLPARLIADFRYRIDFFTAAGYGKLGFWRKAVLPALMAFSRNPVRLIGDVVGRLGGRAG